MFLRGYNTNGFAHHRLEDAFLLLSEIGYKSIAVTVEHDLLHPPDRFGVAEAAKRIVQLRDRYSLHTTIETGARFILDPHRKHQPTLLSSDANKRNQRIEFLKACIDLAAEADASSVSFWSGAPDSSETHEVLWERLVNGVKSLLEHGRGEGVRLALEPEPGMFIATMDQYERLHEAINNARFGLTLDVGHVHCLRDGDAARHIHRWRDKLWNVHIEDMRRDVHEHLAFGDGDIDFAPIFEALREIRYEGPLHVELSRHSHNAVETAKKAFDFLSRF